MYLFILLININIHIGRRSKKKKKKQKTKNYLFDSYHLHYILIGVNNISIVLIWFLTLQYCINLVSTAIFQMEIANVANGKNKKLIYYYININ